MIPTVGHSEKRQQKDQWLTEVRREGRMTRWNPEGF